MQIQNTAQPYKRAHRDWCTQRSDNWLLSLHLEWIRHLVSFLEKALCMGE